MTASLPGLVYRVEECRRCGFRVCVTNDRGEPVPRLEEAFATHVARCATARSLLEAQRERDALRSAEFLRANRGERAAARILRGLATKGGGE